MSEIDKLRARLFDAGAKNMHVDWTDEGRKLSTEERAACLNQALDAIEVGDFDEIEFDENDEIIFVQKTPP